MRKLTVRPAITEDDNRLWNVKEVAAHCGVTVYTVRRWAKKHGLPHIKTPNSKHGRVRFDPKQVSLWITGNFIAANIEHNL